MEKGRDGIAVASTLAKACFSSKRDRSSNLSLLSLSFSPFLYHLPSSTFKKSQREIQASRDYTRESKGETRNAGA